MKKYIIKYSFEFLVIFLGILISLYFEQSRQNRIEKERKNNSISQLITVLDEDIIQIDAFIHLQEMSYKSTNIIYDNLRNNYQISDDSIIYHISSVGRALKSFFPQEGIFNQLISSDLIKRIESEELRRHDVHTKEYDNFFIKFNYSLSENFFLEHNWSTNPNDEKKIKIINYRFNRKYYKSDAFFADIIESKKSIVAYLAELNYLKKSFNDLKVLCFNEIN